MIKNPKRSEIRSTIPSHHCRIPCKGWWTKSWINWARATFKPWHEPWNTGWFIVGIRTYFMADYIIKIIPEFTATIESPILSILYTVHQISANNNNFNYFFCHCVGMDINPWLWNSRQQNTTQKKRSCSFCDSENSHLSKGKRGNGKNQIKQSARNHTRHAMTCQGNQSKERWPFTSCELWHFPKVRDLHSQRSVQDSKFSCITHSARGSWK